MRFRDFWFGHLVVAATFAFIEAAAAAPVPPDSSHATALAAARSAYQEAWAQRQAGEFAGAVKTAADGLARLEAELPPEPDPTSHSDVTDLTARLTELRNAAQADLGNAPPPEPGNEADATVLNAPAVDALEPQLNADVYHWIEFFTGAGRSVFERWLKRSGRYMELFRQVLQKEGLPPDLAHLVFVESGFNLNARSTSAAVGPWQFLRSTGRLFGLTVDQWVDERKDPEKSTVAAARYLKHLYSIFGDWPLALASYNAGEGTVLRAIKRQGTTNYWDLRLPRQTEDYVPQFMAVLAISREPEKYGFESVELDDPMDFDEIALKGAVDLRALARLADCSYEELRQLNPAVLRHAARGAEGVTSIRVPRGKGAVLMERLQQGEELPPVNLTVRHRVQRGETLQGIAAQYHVNATSLARANGIGRKHPLRRGVTLTVPATLRPLAPELVAGDDPRASTSYVPVRNIRPPATLEGRSEASGRTTVTVHRGETLASIAAANGVTVDELRAWNHLKGSRISRGMRLKVRTGAAAETSAADSIQIAQLKVPLARTHAHRGPGAAAPGGATVVVRAGDTLGEIARRHGVTVSALQRANGLSSTRIRSGQRLRLPAS
jgi:membrane-bound lytic murein transglycosylase D